MNRIVLTLLIVGFLASCNSRVVDQPEELERVLTDYFDGVKTRNYQKMTDVTTPDFVLFEDGKIFNNDSLITILNRFQKFEAEYTIDVQKSSIGEKTGSLYYFNKAEFIFNDTTHVTKSWLESATFKKVDNVWKMDFLHSSVRK